MTAHKKEHSHDGAAFRIESATARRPRSGIRMVSAATLSDQSPADESRHVQCRAEREPGAADGGAESTGGIRVRWCNSNGRDIWVHGTEHGTSRIWYWQRHSGFRYARTRNSSRAADAGRDAT